MQYLDLTLTIKNVVVPCRCTQSDPMKTCTTILISAYMYMYMYMHLVLELCRVFSVSIWNYHTLETVDVFYA